MHLTRKRVKKINAVYSLEGTVLENVDSIKYIGVTISKEIEYSCEHFLHKIKQNT